jgi:hypothetical protein
MTKSGVKRQTSVSGENNSGDDPATVASGDGTASQIDDDGYAASANEIEREFAARLGGLRRLRPRERALARRMAYEWRRDALTALAERTAMKRRSKIFPRRLRPPQNELH